MIRRSCIALCIALGGCAPGTAKEPDAVLVTPPAAQPAPSTVATSTARAPKAAVAFAGVDFSPVLGYLHIVVEQGKVSGKWSRPSKDKWGELSGEVDGDTLRFTWSEYRVGAVGPGSKAEGRGTLRYRPPTRPGADATLAGELPEGSPIDLVKQADSKADPSAIGGADGADWEP